MTTPCTWPTRMGTGGMASTCTSMEARTPSRMGTRPRISCVWPPASRRIIRTRAMEAEAKPVGTSRTPTAQLWRAARELIVSARIVRRHVRRPVFDVVGDPASTDDYSCADAPADARADGSADAQPTLQPTAQLLGGLAVGCYFVGGGSVACTTGLILVGRSLVGGRRKATSSGGRRMARRRMGG